MLEPVSGRTERDVKTVRDLSDLLKRFRLKMALDDVSVIIAHVANGAIAVANRDRRAFGGAHPDRVDGQSVCGGFAGLGDAAALKVLPISDENDDLEIVVGGESGFRLLDRRREVGASVGDDVGIHRVEGLEKGVVVEGEGALKKGAAGEGDEADAVPLKLVHKVLNRELGPDEPVGLDILREHAARGVEGEDNVDPPAMALGPGVAPLRAGKGEKEEDHPEENDSVLQAPAEWTVGLKQSLQEPIRGKAADAGFAAPSVDLEKKEEEDDGYRKEVEPKFVREFDHRSVNRFAQPGRGRNRVFTRRSSRPRRRAAAKRGQWNNS